MKEEFKLQVSSRFVYTPKGEKWENLPQEQKKEYMDKNLFVFFNGHPYSMMSDIAPINSLELI